MMDLTKEVVDLDVLLNDTTYVLDRVFTQIPYALDILTNLVPDEIKVLSQYEIPRLILKFLPYMFLQKNLHYQHIQMI